MKLYNIFYVGYGANGRCYEDTTDDFKKWLECHNLEREEDCQEDKDDFDVVEITPIIYKQEIIK